jgi:KAP family P-loop domain
MNSIYKSPKPYVGDASFADDYFKRKPIAEKLMSYFEQLHDGCVIAIDAPWGEGKTWFAQNFAALLKANEFSTAYIDAFETDYGDDPFLAIVSSLLGLMESEEDKQLGKTFVKKASKLGAQILPIAAKIVIGAGARWGIGEKASKEVGEIVDKAIDDADDYLEKIIEKKLEAHQKEKASIEGFRDALAEFASIKNKPIIIFIDELDRCRPTYAISMIERIKHFFDVKNVIFVLVINQQQLESTIDKTYGLGGHAKSYLSKFIHFVVPMQRPEVGVGISDSALGSFLKNSFVRHGYQANDGEVTWFCDTIRALAKTQKISLREIDRLVIYYGLSSSLKSSSWVKAYFCFIKIALPECYSGIKKNDPQAHKQAIEMLNKVYPDEQLSRDADLLIAYHTASIKGLESIDPEMQKQLRAAGRNFNRGPLEAFRIFIDAIDVRVS